jgi:ryanodine receptor 2
LTRENLKSIKAFGFTVEKSEISSPSKGASKFITKKLKDVVVKNGYNPKPFDLDNVTLTRDLDDLITHLAYNCHHLWAKNKKEELEKVGASIHNCLVPYELLTDREKAKDLQLSGDLLRFLQLKGYRLHKTINNTEKMNGEYVANNECRFAYNILEKLLEYVDKAAVNMQSIKESTKFSRKGSFKISGQDVKFFTKVVLPLLERYFQSHKTFFLTSASSKEKEMTCRLVLLNIYSIYKLFFLNFYFQAYSVSWLF